MRTLILVIFIIPFAFNSFSATLSVGFGPGIHKDIKSFKEIRERNITPQNFDYSCGPASLATLLNYYFQDKVSEKEIISFLLRNTDLRKVKARRGFSLFDLKNFAKYKGYKVVGYRMDLDYLVNLDKPVLIPVDVKDYSHFVIFRGLKGNRVFLADPALGNITIKIEKFLTIWQRGIGLVLTKSNQEPKGSPLQLSKEEEAILANSLVVRETFGTNLLGHVYGQGEF